MIIVGWWLNNEMGICKKWMVAYPIFECTLHAYESL